MKKHKINNLTVYIEKDEDGIFIGSIPTLQSCYAEGKTQAEMLKNLEQIAILCLRNQSKMGINTFVGIQNITFKNA
jgi:predicted RNase H-like HicB family nuclease